MTQEAPGVGVICADLTEASALIARLRESDVLPEIPLVPLSPPKAVASTLRGVIVALPCDRPVDPSMKEAISLMTEGQTPRLLFLDGIDAPEANPYARSCEIREISGRHSVMLQLPAPPRDRLPWGVIDLLSMVTRRAGFQASFIPQELCEQASEYRESLIDMLSIASPDFNEATLEEPPAIDLLEATCARTSALPGWVLIALGASPLGVGLAPLGALVGRWFR